MKSWLAFLLSLILTFSPVFPSVCSASVPPDLAGNAEASRAADGSLPDLTGQPGDLIQMGENGSWRHVVIISQTVTDESGQTIDYLVHSNTSNLVNWPASLYGYPQRLLTRIAGWND